MTKYIKDSRETEILPQYSKLTISDVPTAKTIESIIPIASSPSLDMPAGWPAKDLTFELPTLSTRQSLVPGSLCLLVFIKSNKTKSWFLNNIANLLKRGLMVTFSDEDTIITGERASTECTKTFGKPKRLGMAWWLKVWGTRTQGSS